MQYLIFIKWFPKAEIIASKCITLPYQNQIQTSAHPPLCHRWNATEVTYKAYNLHNK